MDGALIDALERLSRKVAKQNELQDEANTVMRAMTQAIQALAQEIADQREA